MSQLILPANMQNRNVAIDLRYHTFKRERGQWALFATWHFGSQPVPCFVILDRFRTYSDQTPVVLLQSQMHMFHEGEWDWDELSKTLARFGYKLGIDMLSKDPLATKQRADLVSLVVDHLDDLKDMPPAPKRHEKKDLPSLGEIQVNATVNGKELTAATEVKVAD